MNVVMVLLAALIAAAARPVVIPAEISRQLPQLHEAGRLEQLPRVIAHGPFQTTYGYRIKQWKLAEPGAPFQSTDVVVKPGLPNRRMIVGGCDRVLCLLHYEIGGIAHSYDILAFRVRGSSYTAFWHATGDERYPTLAALRHALEHKLRHGDWRVQRGLL